MRLAIAAILLSLVACSSGSDCELQVPSGALYCDGQLVAHCQSAPLAEGFRWGNLYCAEAVVVPAPPPVRNTPRP